MNKYLSLFFDRILASLRAYCRSHRIPASSPHRSHVLYCSRFVIACHTPHTHSHTSHTDRDTARPVTHVLNISTSTSRLSETRAVDTLPMHHKSTAHSDRGLLACSAVAVQRTFDPPPVTRSRSTRCLSIAAATAAAPTPHPHSPPPRPNPASREGVLYSVPR